MRYPVSSGRVLLIGAGPGDPDLLTVRAYRAIMDADVVLHDALVSPEILSLAAGAELVNVGKIGGGPRVEQDEIHALLLAYAQAGRDVVRLKGGDAFVFGRGGEEALFLAAHGIRVEVVPGITSAIAAASAANIPVTHRGVSTHFTVLTGHPMEGGEEALEAAWARAAQLGGTLVFLMGLRNIARIMEVLLSAGLPSTTPVAVIQDGTRSSQRVLTAEVSTVAAKVAQSKLRAPAIVVVGDVVQVRAALAASDVYPSISTLEPATSAS